jgi:hypothetical protein
VVRAVNSSPLRVSDESLDHLEEDGKQQSELSQDFSRMRGLSAQKWFTASFITTCI